MDRIRGIKCLGDALRHPEGSVRTALLEPGRFDSPQGMAVDAQGNLYVAEWLIGGRSTKLAKVS
jgi:sugar lactone lactonase YvrE